MRSALALAACLLAAGCYDPRIPSGAFRCGANGLCPEGLSCQDGLCVRSTPPRDGTTDGTRSDGGNADGPIPPAGAGCSDGTREALGDTAMFPDLAACDGAWNRPGVVFDPPHCNRAAGNTGSNPVGDGCNVADLCALGWHVCVDQADVATRGGPAACGALAQASGVLYVTRERGDPVSGACGPAISGNNNVYGCGTLGGLIPLAAACMPFDHWLRVVAGECPAPWDCGTDPANEGQNVIKTGLPGGGVLCCRD